jgi:hypothetical protein
MNVYDNLYLAYNNKKELFLVLPPDNMNNFTINYIDIINIIDMIDNNHVIDNNIIENNRIQTRNRTAMHMLCLLIIVIIIVTTMKLIF